MEYNKLSPGKERVIINKGKTNIKYFEQNLCRALYKTKCLLLFVLI